MPRRPLAAPGAGMVQGAVALAVALATVWSGLAAAGAGSTPPPTPVPPYGSPSPFPTALTTPRPSLRPPHLHAPSAILEDLDTGQVLYSRDAGRRRPMASLTKVMTALVVLSRTRPEEVVVVRRTATVQSGSALGLRVGERITVQELLFALLVQSSNDGAVALAEHVAGTVPRFVRLMNREAIRMGLSHSHFRDPSGLDTRNYSSARDIAAMTREAYDDVLFERIVRTKFHDIPAPSGPNRHIQNRNVMLWLYRGAIGVKTGFTTPAGHCLIAAADRRGMRLVAVAMGASGPEDGGIFNDGAALLNYGFTAFEERTLIRPGDRLGSLAVEGTEVPAVAGAALLRLVRKGLEAEPTLSVIPDPALRLPISAGDSVGRVVIELDGRTAGIVQAVAAITVNEPQPPSPGPAGPGSPFERGLRVLQILIEAVLGPFL